MQLRSPKIDKPNVLVYPNPSSDKFFVSYNLGIENSAILQLSDLNGRLIQTIKLDGTNGLYTIETDMLENGVYLYGIKGTKSIIASGKLVLIK